MTTYVIKESDYQAASSANKGTLKPLRLSENGIVGAVEEIESDVVLPGTRIPSVPDTGTESSSGNTESEFNIDEQDDLIASVMCSSWVTDSEQITGNVIDYKTLVLGTDKEVWRMIKKFAQAPAEWREFTGLQVNEMTLTLALNSFAKLSFGWLGSNNPKSVSVDPIDSTKFDYGAALTTKSFKTLEGYLKIGALADNFSNMTQIRQAPNLDLTINNNKERTDALFETEAIEMSDGDFDVSGNIDIWKADALGMSMFNDAVDGVDKCIEVQLSRTVSDIKTSYTIQIKAHLKGPSESKDGNKYKVTAPFSMNFENGLKFIKKVEEVS